MEVSLDLLWIWEKSTKRRILQTTLTDCGRIKNTRNNYNIEKNVLEWAGKGNVHNQVDFTMLLP